MISRAHMRRQLRAKGGITDVVQRTNYLFGGIKKRIRKLIPNEIADVAVKAAPFVAPFSPKTAALMRGIGRFDQRGSISDAVKQGIGTFAFGAGARKLGGAENVFGDFSLSSPLSEGRTKAIGSLFDKGEGGKKAAEKLAKDKSGILPKSILEKTTMKIPGVRALPKIVQEQLLVGGITSGASLLASYFQGDFREQEPGETMEDYLAARKVAVGKQMRTYMDNYYASDPEYSALDDAGRDMFVARYNVKDGGRIEYQTGGISSANTLAENIARNRANQAAFNQMIRPAQIRAAKITDAKITPAKITDAKITPAKITDAKITPIETRDLNLNRNPALDLLNQPQQPQFLTPTKTQIQTGPQPGELDPLGLPITSTIVSPLTPTGMQSLAELNAIRDRVLAAQAAMKPTYQERLMGESWETLSDNDQYRIAMEYPGETPPRRNPDFVPNVDAGLSGQEIAEKYGIPYAKGGRVEFSEGSNLKIKLKQIGYEDTLLDGMSLKELRELLDSEKGTFTGQGTYREPANMGGAMPTGIMRSNQAGVMERDYRDKGGFVPVGIKEKADDVPAMLSKNEFVMTANAVRGAGNGSIEKGAQRMYDTMKRLEKRAR